MPKAPAHMRFAVMAVDAVVFALCDGELCVLVDTVNRSPHYVNLPGFLGGLISPTETAEEAAIRILTEKGDLTVAHLEQLATFSAVDRDKRNRVVSVAHLGLVRPDTAATYQHESAAFVPVLSLSEMAFDHQEMLQVALTRLRGKFAYTTIVQFLLPRHFTLSELQRAYETVLDTTFDKRNFRKKIHALGIVRGTGRVQEGVHNRPAALYTFARKKLGELPLFG